jgi:type IV secretory pathway VirB3-like protein
MKGLIHLGVVIGIVSTIAIVTESPLKVGIGFIVGLGYLLIINNKSKVIKAILLGFKIAEENRDKSQWGKF